MSKTSRLDTIFFDEPPYYKEDVLINLEEMNLTNSQSIRELNKNFKNIFKTLEHGSNNIVSSLENEAEKARIQSSIENEKLANGISETNYRLLDVANGIEGLSDVIRDGNENIVEAIGRSSEQIIEGLAKINDSMDSLDFQMRMVNNSLGIISNQLGELLKKISKPNETKALELADQARINLSLNKKEIALKVTRSALELSNGTSITVLAYHILTLSLFDDDASEKEIIETYEDYVNLVGFKLSDRQSDTEVVVQEINNTLYPVMSTMGYCQSSIVVDTTLKLYSNIYSKASINQLGLKKETHFFDLQVDTAEAAGINIIKIIRSIDDCSLEEARARIKKNSFIVKKRILIDEAEKLKKQFEEIGALVEVKPIYQKYEGASFLSKPLLDNSTLDMINQPNILREVHWSILLKENVIKKQSLNVYVAYIVTLAKSHVLIKNELMILAIRHFYEEGFLYGTVVDSLTGNSDDTLNDALRVILSVLPQDIIGIDQKTYWAMKLYADTHRIKVNATLEAEFTEAAEYVKIDIEENYISLFDNLQQEMYDKENEITPQIEATQKEHREVSKKKTEEWEKHNKAIDYKGQEERIKRENIKANKAYPVEYDTYIAIFVALLFGIGYVIDFYPKLSFIDYDGAVIVTHGTGTPLLFQIVYYIPILIVLIIIGAFLGYWIGKIIDTMRINIYTRSIDKSKKSISNYKKELPEIYNIKVKKEQLDASYYQKISNLSNQLNPYKQSKIDYLTSKLNMLVERYTPSKTEQLLKPDAEIKKCIEDKIIGGLISTRRPKDLDYKQSKTSSSAPKSPKKKKYVEIDMTKVAEEYGARWGSLHNTEQPTTEKLIAWIEDEAYRGDGMAQYLLGTIYEDDDAVYGIEVDIEKALFWFRKAAQNDIAEAQCKMGEAYMNGEGVKSSMLGAFNWFEKAKDLGHPSGKYNYGLIRFVGSTGIKQDVDEGIYWIKEARDDGLDTARDFIAKEGLK